MRTEALKKAQARYEKSGAIKKRVTLKFTRADEDIIKFLEGKDNVSGYIKSLIRKDKGEG